MLVQLLQCAKTSIAGAAAFGFGMCVLGMLPGHETDVSGHGVWKAILRAEIINLPAAFDLSVAPTDGLLPTGFFIFRPERTQYPLTQISFLHLP